MVTFENYTSSSLHVDEIKHTVTMLLIGGSFSDLSEAKFFTVEGNNFVAEVTLNSGKITVENVPRYVTSLTLFGMLDLDCNRHKVALSNVMGITINTPLKTSGVFKPVNYDTSVRPMQPAL